MKKLMFAIIIAIMPAMANAQSEGLFARKKIKAQQDMSAYLQGAVKEENGKVVFKRTIAVPGKSKQYIYQSIMQWASLRYQPNISRGEWDNEDFYKNYEYATIKSADEAEGIIVCRGDEEVIFSNKPLSKDFCRMNYNLMIEIKDNEVTATVANISYQYALTETPERIVAEDWITDKEAINKKGQLMRISGKFRVKTIDITNELFKEITEFAAE
ncbi:MAG: DUF4468 domain-containing protein [Bacteroides sp.]|nr:DUF4468 domain-containing protein [Roseburia sp.]MCM1346686.1 DUF4468 domain-containing protein [Bacteroides sp.]MCM1421254.1 DUF4468 domain-containing protein [Bacteroides sp.]